MRSLLLLLAPLALASCDVRIACEADADCPGSQPFCVDRFCAADDDDADGEDGDDTGGEGEGEEGEGEEGEGEEGEGEEGEGEGTAVCAVDADCDDGLCWLDGAVRAELVGQCLPGAGETEPCGGSTAARDVGGPALAVLSLAINGACTPGPEVSYAATVAWRDDDGDIDGSGFGLEVTAPGGAFGAYPVQWDNSTGVEGSGDTGTTTFLFCAFAEPAQLGLQLFDVAGRGSDVVCVAP